MNKTAIKNYAIWARVQLIESAKQRAYEYEITENSENNPNLETIGGRLLSKAEKEQRQQLIAQIRQKGYTQVMEEAAYTWFNRFIALRFMEVNGYLPSKVRVFTNENDVFKPEILKEAISIELEGLNRQVVLELLDSQDNETLYKILLIAQCNALNNTLPYMFEKIDNWTELLFPANLLRQDSVIGTMISEISEEDWREQVQIIGWLYQYYITEINALVYDGNMSKSRIPKELLPAATQIFTPDWVVRYMVENSLGRLWYESHRDFDKSDWKYYLDSVDQEPEVERQLQIIRSEYAQQKPEEIKVIDPCMGSGHMLVYAFDVLMQIYTAAGWSERDAAQSILENNLYGLDIDDRAAQLAYFAVMMKARQYDRQALRRGIQPHVYAIQASERIDPSDLACYGKLTEKAKSLYFCFAEAKEYGSILKMPVTIEEVAQLREKGREILVDCDTTFRLDEAAINRSAVLAMNALLDQAEALAQKYDVVFTNPPYLGNSRFSEKLLKYVVDHYPDGKADLSTVMYLKSMNDLAKQTGMISFITITSWMFLSSFEKYRDVVLEHQSIVNLVDFGSELFDGKVGHNLIAAWVARNTHVYSTIVAVRLVDYNYSRRDEKEAQFFNEQNRYVAQQNNFSKIPGRPVAYWVKKEFISLYGKKTFVDYFSFKRGMATGDNDRFLRFWYEVAANKLSVFSKESMKWQPYNKGGDFRKWYGNRDYVINWEDDGFEVKHVVNSQGKPASRPQNIQYNYVENISYSSLTSGSLSFRRYIGFINDQAGNFFVVGGPMPILFALGLLNSKAASYCINLKNSTLNTTAEDFKAIPIPSFPKDYIDNITRIVSECEAICRSDWDSFETSWDFQDHAIVRWSNNLRDATAIGCAMDYYYGYKPEVHSPIELCYMLWQGECNERFKKLKANEEELNRSFIEIYGLQDELTPEVADKDITVRKADLGRDIRSLISYAVGCMMGRYSLDKPGLAFAGGNWEEYKANSDHLTAKSYPPDNDGILPITDDEYFDDDIVGIFVNWVRAVYGADTLEENLRFIANALGGKGTPREVIRQYFLNDFYADHLKVYQKRPIYWLFSSGKKNGFKCLIYMHRYQPDLLARIRTDYVHEQQERYRTQLTMLEESLQTASASEHMKLNKQITKIKDQARELQNYEEKIHHLADQMISIDLDDGVKVNYAKFQDVLEKIK